jgi:hypothetical protein
MYSGLFCNETLRNIQVRLSTGRSLLCNRCQKMTLSYASGTDSYCIFTHTFWAWVHMNCLTGDLMKGIFQSYGTGYRSCHFCISYAYSWSFLFSQHVHNKAACWLLLAWAEYPFLLVHQVQWSAGFFLRGIRPLQGLSRGVFPQTDSKKKEHTVLT